MSQSYSALSDSKLIALCLDRDDEAWEALLRRFKRLIAWIALKHGMSNDEVDDIFQSVCFALYQQLPNLRNQEKISSWIITVTVRECWKVRRRLRKQPIGDTEVEALAAISDHTIAVDDSLLRLERQHLLRQGIDLLPENCRRLLVQLFYQEAPAPYSEIAGLLEMPVASIGPTRGRCLEKLKSELAKLGFF